MTRRPAETTIPTFLLYEERSEPEIDADFVHVETVSARAGLHNWEIRPHRHASLHQFLLVLAGGGRLDAEGVETLFGAPSVIAVPATLVHSFLFRSDAEGFVLTVSDAFLDRVLQRGGEPLAAPAAASAVAVTDAHELATLTAAFRILAEEAPWARPGRMRACAAALELILTTLSRRPVEARRDLSVAGRARDLAARFRVMVRDRAAEGWDVPRYARALGVSPESLTRACRLAAGRSPLELVHDRLIAEAKRGLIYTAMTVQDVGLSLGFRDPAYFTRFFTRKVGCSPQRFRLTAARS